jgi:hypothetical protein
MCLFFLKLLAIHVAKTNQDRSLQSNGMKHAPVVLPVGRVLSFNARCQTRWTATYGTTSEQAVRRYLRPASKFMINTVSTLRCLQSFFFIIAREELTGLTRRHCRPLHPKRRALKFFGHLQPVSAMRRVGAR